MSSPARSGFTLVETAMSIVLLGVIVGSIALVSSSTTGAYKTGAEVARQDQQARRVLNEIGEYLQASSRDSFSPASEAPLSTPTADFQRSVGYDGDVIWGDPERITFEYSPLDADDGIDNDGNGLVDEGRVVWIENPGLADERRIVLCSGVREFAEGEIPNGIDDNGNGLIDERGLSFVVEVERVTIRLSLESRDDQGIVIVRSVQRTVSFRNKD